MSWSFYAKGSAAECRKIVEGQKISESFPLEEQTQVTKVKELLLFTLDNIKDETKDWNISANGYMSTYVELGQTKISNVCKVSIETIMRPEAPKEV